RQGASTSILPVDIALMVVCAKAGDETIQRAAKPESKVRMRPPGRHENLWNFGRRTATWQAEAGPLVITIPFVLHEFSASALRPTLRSRQESGAGCGGTKRASACPVRGRGGVGT